jgi:Spy/CpxP family protein refolding chaperone
MRLTRQKLAALAAVAGMLTLTIPARGADENPAPQPGAGGNGASLRERMQRAGEQLNLTAAQKEKVRTIFQSLTEKMRAVRGDSALSAEQRMEKMKALREEFTPKFKEVLTAEQFEKWQELRGQTGGRIQEALKELNLTAEQKEKLRPIFQQEMEKLRAMRADTSLTPQQKLEKFKALREEAAPKVKEVLTPEQYAKWEKQVAQAGGRLQKRFQQLKEN